MANVNSLFRKAGLALVLPVAALLSLAGCKTDSTTSTAVPGDHYALYVSSGPQTVSHKSKINLQTVLLDDTGGQNAVPNSLSYTITPSYLGTVTSTGVFTASGADSAVGAGVLTATVTYPAATYTISSLITETKAKAHKSTFAATPGALKGFPGDPDVTLQLIDSNGIVNATGITFSSDKPSVATADANGVVKFVGTGVANIKVTGTIRGQDYTTYVGVWVPDALPAALPVAKVVLDKKYLNCYAGDSATFSAKAYNSSGTDVTAKYPVSYALIAKDTTGPAMLPTSPYPVKITSGASIKALRRGGVYLRATAGGVVDVAEINVLQK